MSDSKYAFLVATLATPDEPRPVPREKHIGSNALVDDREHFLEMCMSRHWQVEAVTEAVTEAVAEAVTGAVTGAVTEVVTEAVTEGVTGREHVE